MQAVLPPLAAEGRRCRWRVIRVVQEQLEIMAEWASQLAVCEYDSQQAWQLAARMVADGRKEVQEDVAGEPLCRRPALCTPICFGGDAQIY